MNLSKTFYLSNYKNNAHAWRKISCFAERESLWGWKVAQ